MRTIAKLIKLTVTDFDTKKAEIKKEVEALTAKYPLYE